MLGKRRFRRRLIIIACILIAILLLIYLPEPIRNARMARANKRSMHEREVRAREMLEKAGITVSDESFARLKAFDNEISDQFDGYGVGLNYYGVSYSNYFAAMLLLYEGAGNIDISAWEPISDEVFAVSEKMWGEDIYKYTLQGINHIVPDVTITDIGDDMGAGGFRHSVTFTIDGQSYRINESNQESAFNADFLTKINKILREHGSVYDLQTWEFQNNIIILYRDAADAARVFNVANQYIK